ncbi:torsin-1A-interacting protein 1-like [Argiope bruennichi]|uniref:Torsin-1A-interacting protein 1/2 AAA+ activator domain-containing protein n=1 Tax=Argiope bruennichi TaxID=94029 RepID=A0A8T0EHU2_ARGBR|nr:torsin-1A-interacting protein 1-like [Argiope bruennichi]KAF8773054.1 hypothetical protein HNY73_015749 [Argiope bruennichi]
MSPKKPKQKNVANKFELTRRPLYPDLNAEKENMDVSSSDDSPEKKFLDSPSPRNQRKNLSPSSTDSFKDVANNLKYRSGRHQQNLNQYRDRGNENRSPKNRYSENSDDFDNSNYLPDQEQEISENSPGSKKKNYSSDRFEDSADDRRYDQPLKQSPPKRYASVSTSEPSNFFSSVTFLIICFIIFIIIIALFITFYVRYPDTSHVNDPATTLVNSLRSKFGDQPKMTFRIIHSALKNVLVAQPKSPAIILLLATNGSKTVCSDFANKLVDLLSVPKFTLKFSGEDFKLASVNKAKMDIDKKIDKTLKINQLGSVLIEDLDHIPGQAAIILHKYYDHENAPFKKAVFVMTINLNKAITDYSDLTVWDKAANDHLLSVWIDTGVDQVTALLSRLTVSVAVITVESLK